MTDPEDLNPFPDSAFDPTALVLYGGGGHGKTLIDLVRALGGYRLAGVIDDSLSPGSQVLGLAVLGPSAILPDLYKQGIRQAINGIGGIGNPEIRLKAFETLTNAGFTCPTVIHPSAWVEPSAELESGVQVLAQSYVSSAVHIAAGTVLNACVVVSHDCTLGSCVNLSPGAMLAGDVHLGDYVQVGMAATINLHITVGKGARIGNGATVKADVPAGTRVRAGTIWPPLESSAAPFNIPEKKV